jgi:hypothetical protein
MKGDTIMINPPLTYEQLSVGDQQSFHNGALWFRNAQIILNEDGTVKSSGDFDPGYKRWKLVDNDADIEMTLGNGTTLILRNWMADPFNFSYTGPYNTTNKSFECTSVISRSRRVLLRIFRQINS